MKEFSYSVHVASDKSGKLKICELAWRKHEYGARSGRVFERARRVEKEVVSSQVFREAACAPSSLRFVCMMTCSCMCVMRPLHAHTDDSEDLLARSIVAGYFRNVTWLRPDGRYELIGVEGDTKAAVGIHPCSALTGNRPR